MKNSTNTTVILKAFDLELKTLLQADLESLKVARQTQSQVKQAAWSTYIIIYLFYQKSSHGTLFFWKAGRNAKLNS